jgi:hypothetical protein
VEHGQLAGAVSRFRYLPVVRQDVAADDIRRDERTTIETQVVDDEQHAHVVEGHDLSGGGSHQRAHPLADSLYQVGLVVEGITEGLEAHEPGRGLEDLGHLNADLHPVGEDEVEVLQDYVAEFLGFGPGVGLEILPALDGAAGFILPVAHTAGPVGHVRRVSERDEVAAEAEAGR